MIIPSKSSAWNAGFDLFALDCKDANWSNKKYFEKKMFEDNKQQEIMTK